MVAKLRRLPSVAPRTVWRSASYRQNWNSLTLSSSTGTTVDTVMIRSVQRDENDRGLGGG